MARRKVGRNIRILERRLAGESLEDIANAHRLRVGTVRDILRAELRLLASGTFRGQQEAESLRGEIAELEAIQKRQDKVYRDERELLGNVVAKVQREVEELRAELARRRSIRGAQPVEQEGLRERLIEAVKSLSKVTAERDALRSRVERTPYDIHNPPKGRVR